MGNGWMIFSAVERAEQAIRCHPLFSGPARNAEPIARAVLAAIGSGAGRDAVIAERRLIAQLIDGGDSDLADYDPSDEALSKADNIICVITSALASPEKAGPTSPAETRHLTASEQRIMHKALRASIRPVEATPPATHGSAELDEDAAKLIALGADPGPTFADPLTTPPALKPVGGGYLCDCGTRDIDETCHAGMDCRAVKAAPPAASDLRERAAQLVYGPGDENDAITRIANALAAIRAEAESAGQRERMERRIRYCGEANRGKRFMRSPSR